MSSPQPVRFDEGDFPREEWARRYLRTLNTFVSEVVQVLTKGIRFRDNVDCAVVELEYIGGNVPFPVATKYTSTPLGLFVLGAWLKTSPSTAITSAVWPSWRWDNDRATVMVTNVTGLTSGTAYVLRLLVLGG